MGALTSLSRSETSCGLAASEYLLLAFALIVVIGLVGEHKLPWYHARLKTFEVLVMIGCGGELLADGGVFLFSRQMEKLSNIEIVRLAEKTSAANLLTTQLEAQIQSRLLSKQQVNELSAALPELSGYSLLMWSIRYDGEAGFLAKQIKSAFNRKGIGVDVDSVDRIGAYPGISHGAEIGGFEEFPSEVRMGVEVWSSNERIAESVTQLLLSVGKLSARASPKSEFPPGGRPERFIAIFVGTKPYPDLK